MSYNESLVSELREKLDAATGKEITEKRMFGGYCFMVDGKMCINVSGDNLMCRFDPALDEEIAERKGYLPMIMKGKELKGYCYVSPEGFHRPADFDWWINLCLEFNKKAKAGAKKK